MRCRTRGRARRARVYVSIRSRLKQARPIFFQSLYVDLLFMIIVLGFALFHVVYLRYRNVADSGGGGGENRED